MKKNIYLVLGLAAMLALIWDAAALSCTMDSDCNSLDGARDSPNFCGVNLTYYITYYNVTDYFCNASGVCEKGPSVAKLDQDCSALPMVRTSPYFCWSYLVGRPPLYSMYNSSGHSCNATTGLCYMDTEYPMQLIYQSCVSNTTILPESCDTNNTYHQTAIYYTNCNVSTGFCGGAAYRINFTINNSYNEYLTTAGTYCVGNKVYRSYNTYVCNLSEVFHRSVNGTISSEYDDCDRYTQYGCINGDEYHLDNACDTGTCEVSTATLLSASYPGCGYTTACEGDAQSLSFTDTHVAYNVLFDKNYTLDQGTYIVPPGSTMNLSYIREVYNLCGNSGWSNPINAMVWVYNVSDGKKLKTATNNMEIGSSLDRSDVIGDNSSIYGTPILNPLTSVFNRPEQDWLTRTNIPRIYNFTGHHNHTVFIDIISGYCVATSDHLNALSDNTTIAPNYICPWLGGTARSNLCYDSEGNLADGWTPRETLNVLVASPNISIAAPPGEPDVKPGTVSKEWLITNNGVGKVNMSIKLDCGGWTCVFDSGYVAGRQVQLEEGELYNVPVNVTTNPAQQIHDVGIIVTYDDGYNLTAIPSQNKSSYITFGAPIIT